MGTSQQPQLKHMEQCAVDLFSVENPRSVINLVSPKVAQCAHDFLKTHAGYFNISEDTLRRQLTQDCAPPSKVDDALRVRFWLEYDRCQSHGLESMVMENIFAGVVTKQYFFQYFIVKANHFAWMFCPPLEYLEIMKAALNRAQDFLADVMREEVDLKDLSAKDLAYLKLRVYKELDVKLGGARLPEAKPPAQAPVQVNIQNIQTRDSISPLVDRETLLKEQNELKEKESRIDSVPSHEARLPAALDMTKKLDENG